MKYNNSFSNVIICSFSSYKKFEIVNIKCLRQDSGTNKLYIDDCISNKFIEYLSSDGSLLVNINQKFDSGLDKADNIYNVYNPYYNICEIHDYLTVKDVKYGNGTIITNDYGLFACAYLEGLKPIYLPNKEQLKKGIQYFYNKIFLKNINNKIWFQKHGNLENYREK